MTRLAVMFVVAAFVAGAAPAAVSADARAPALVHGLPLPPRSRVVGDDHFISGRGFRQTVQYYQRHLRRQGIDHDAVPIYSYRGVTVARFIPRTERRWRALHIFTTEGRTHIYIVPHR